MQLDGFLAATRPTVFFPQADFHPGNPAPIGFAAYFSSDFPAILGGDGGCGVLCAEVTRCEPDFEALQAFLKEKVQTQGHESYSETELEELFRYVSELCGTCASELSEYLSPRVYIAELRRFAKQFRVGVQMQSLGTGNHFLEFGAADSGRQYVTVHCGSRNAGIKVFQSFQAIARAFNQRGVTTKAAYWEALLRDVANGTEVAVPRLLLPEFKHVISTKFKQATPQIMKLVTEENNAGVTSGEVQQQLLPLPDDCKYSYRAVYSFLVATAVLNRFSILREVTAFLGVYVAKIVAFAPHNYFSGTYVLKGAYLIQPDRPFVVCLNCRDGVLVCRSPVEQLAPHGAGRALGRAEAAKMASQDVAGVVRFWKSAAEEPVSYKSAAELKERLLGQQIEILEEVRAVFSYKHGR